MSRSRTTAKSRRFNAMTGDNFVPHDFQDRNTPVDTAGGYHTMQDGSRRKCAR